MTKKDYELIAKTLFNQRYMHTGVDIETLDMTCKLLAGQLMATNPRFDRNRFLQACGVEV